jgi:hypothetical protein
VVQACACVQQVCAKESNSGVVRRRQQQQQQRRSVQESRGSGLQKGRKSGEICEEHGGASKEHRVNKKARVIHGSSSGMQLGMPTPTSTPKGLVNSPCRLAAPTNRAVQAGAGHCWETGHSPVKVGRSWLEANRSGKSATPGPADREQYHHSPQGGQIVVEANRWWKSANHPASDTKE